MAIYAKFAAFYDEIMGDRSSETGQIRAYIAKYLPGAKSLLELGCGTGALLTELAGDLAVTGVDQSPEMLSIAARRVPEATLVQGDISKFALDARFDVIICMFDTLNHVPRFESWLEVFGRVHEHLADGGLFIFDVNTAGRLRALGNQPPYVQDFGQHTLIMNITPIDGKVYHWEVKIFERLEDDLFRLHYESILQLGMPLATIREALAVNFDLLEEADPDEGLLGENADRIYFVYRHVGGVDGADN